MSNKYINFVVDSNMSKKCLLVVLIVIFTVVYNIRSMGRMQAADSQGAACLMPPKVC